MPVHEAVTDGEPIREARAKAAASHTGSTPSLLTSSMTA